MSAERVSCAAAAPSASEQPWVASLPDDERASALGQHAPAKLADDGYVTPPRDCDCEKPCSTSAAAGAAESAALSYSPATSGANKRKRVEMSSSAISEAAETAASLIAASNAPERSVFHTEHRMGEGRSVDTARPGRALDVGTAPTKRKSSSNFLRKGQWTTTEERLARSLIVAFEEGYLPIYTGIRLRGYLAVQLQCDPMRVSKKLCAGAVDGKRVPRNYGQKKFKQRKKANWDREEAGRILATLEKLTDELWRESAVARPPFLTLSSTRNADEDESSAALARDASASPGSPGQRLSPPVIKKHKSVVFPIIYLNLSKKHKQRPTSHSNSSHSSSEADPVGDSSPSMSEDDEHEDVKKTRKKATRGKPKPVDGESLQAAYDLLTLCQPSHPGGDKAEAAQASTGASSLAPVVTASAP